MADLPKVAAATAAEVLARYKPAKSTLAIAREGDPPGTLVDALAAAGEAVEARRFLAQALPVREAVWWAVQAVESTLPPDETPERLAALAAARAWVAEPTEAHRRAAWDAAQASEFDNPLGLTALAVFLSGGSLSPEGLPAVPPAAHLAAETAANAMTVASLTPKAADAAAKNEAFWTIGLAVAADRSPFPEPEKAK
jgi:hypothetical protein